MDSENMFFSRINFDKIICQYGMMFFSNPLKVLNNIREYLTKGGKLIIAVQGNAEKVPYFSCIMRNIMKHIPNIIPKDSPNVHSLGDDSTLEKILTESNYSNIKILKRNFVYNAGSFERYGNDYIETTANSLRKTIKDSGKDTIDKIKSDSKIETAKYL